MNEHFESYQDFLIEELKGDRELAIGYLKEALLDDDPRILFIALRNVTLAYAGDVESIFRESIKQQSLHLNKWITDDGTAELGNVNTIFPQLKLQLLVLQGDAALS